MIKQLLDSVFVISRIIEVSVRVNSLSLRLITPASTSIILVITYRAKLLNPDWLRQRAFFLNHEGTFGNQEGMIT